MKVCHLTSVHKRDDIRVFVKMSSALTQRGIDIVLVVADGLGDEDRSGVKIIDVGRIKGRLGRILFSPKRILKRALEIEADVFQMHDPELLSIALALQKKGKCVVFDSHEDAPKQLLAKPYLSSWVLRLLSIFLSRYQERVFRRLNGLVFATPGIARAYSSLNRNSVVVNNYPILKELLIDVSWESRGDELCYLGGVTEKRGIKPMLESLGLIRNEVKLNLAGRFSEPDLERACRSRQEWKLVVDHGFVDRDGVKGILARSRVGLVTLLPTPNHMESQPIKMFEYMAAGVPVVASNFPLWREIVEGNDCGLCVDPTDPVAIAAAVDYLIDNPERASQMGRNGQKAVMSNYSWETEENCLIRFYECLSGV